MATIPYPIVALASSQSHIVAAAGPSITVIDSASPSAISSDPSSSTSVVRLTAISADGKHIASLTDDKVLTTYNLSSSPLSLTIRNTRNALKKGSHLSFSSDNDIILSDKVGDIHRYPLDPKPIEGERPPPFILNADPSRNPDADLLAGHVSIVTAHLITPDGKHLITADRDEHIRLSRYPRSYVIERYLFGTDGFVSALHIPPSDPEVLLSAGGENAIRIWNWTTGEQLGRFDIWQEVLPHRRVRCAMRKLKRAGKKARLDLPANVEVQQQEFYTAPQGWLLPTGQGVCVKKIESVQVGQETVILFSSEGCAALHSFILPSDPVSPPFIHTLPLPYPLVDFTAIPGEDVRLLLSLDTTWGVLKQNPGLDGVNTTSKAKEGLTEEEGEMIKQSLAVVQVETSGQLVDITSGSLTLLDPVYRTLQQSHQLINPSTIANLNLYGNLSLLPRWPGLEEDDDLAGTNEQNAGSEATQNGDGAGKEWTADELEKMNVKQLGRLRSQGVAVEEVIARKRKQGKGKKSDKNKDIGEGGDGAEVVQSIDA
ncbi:WD40-repeat-containing domain protein [Naematelia encephala]|uniref:WD40-repeat-containing domain protein n=1 Tax=Naematelia encephala TaxID=71784 RepID=A0A1Y2BBN9_9TREE|nr:WD40-repeat-containing domain protein [Naematelia encephala]